LVNLKAISSLLQADTGRAAMTVLTATLSRVLVERGTVLTIDGTPRPNDMLRIVHENGTHSAAFVEALAGDRLVLMLLGNRAAFRCQAGEKGGSTWVAD